MLGTGRMSHSKAFLISGHMRGQSLTERQWIPMCPVEKRLMPPVPEMPGLPACSFFAEACAWGVGALTLIACLVIQSSAIWWAWTLSGIASWVMMFGSYCR